MSPGTVTVTAVDFDAFNEDETLLPAVTIVAKPYFSNDVHGEPLR